MSSIDNVDDSHLVNDLQEKVHSLEKDLKVCYTIMKEAFGSREMDDVIDMFSNSEILSMLKIFKITGWPCPDKTVDLFCTTTDIKVCDEILTGWSINCATEFSRSLARLLPTLNDDQNNGWVRDLVNNKISLLEKAAIRLIKEESRSEGGSKTDITRLSSKFDKLKGSRFQRGDEEKETVFLVTKLVTTTDELD